MSAEKPQMITLQSNDGVSIEVGMPPPPPPPTKRADMLCSLERKVAERSMLIKNMMEDLGDEAISTAVPIPNVSPPSSRVPDVMAPFAPNPL